MKIGILTLPIAENYGGILQAVALYQLLEQEGHEVTLIYKPHNHNVAKKIAHLLTDWIPPALTKKAKNIPIINRLHSRAQRKIRAQLHKSFIQSEISKITPPLSTYNQLNNYIKHNIFDAIIVGSDQVWRREYIFDKHYKCYFLNFVNTPNTKKIAYAASFGKGYWEGNNDQKDIEKLLYNFNAISVRESSGVNICKNTFNQQNVSHVLDPTLLHEKCFYEKIIKKYNYDTKSKSQTLTYILDESPDKEELINILKTNKVNHLYGFNSSDEFISVPQWLSHFRCSELIITDSFHGMVFSIIFEKQFVVIGNKDRGLDRFKSLLTLLELEHRLIFTLKDALQLKNKEPINYREVNSKLAKLKSQSINFLMQALN